jgi:hypothetical protein
VGGGGEDVGVGEDTALVSNFCLLKKMTRQNEFLQACQTNFRYVEEVGNNFLNRPSTDLPNEFYQDHNDLMTLVGPLHVVGIVVWSALVRPGIVPVVVSVSEDTRVG